MGVLAVVAVAVVVDMDVILLTAVRDSFVMLSVLLKVVLRSVVVVVVLVVVVAVAALAATSRSVGGGSMSMVGVVSL